MQPADSNGCGDIIAAAASWEGVVNARLPSNSPGVESGRRAAVLRRRAMWRVVTITALLLAINGARAEPVVQFFARKTVTITIGYTAGGSYDLYGRMLARHLGKHIPGEPTVIAQ